MPHDPEKYLYDALEASRTILGFVKGKTYSDYRSDKLLRSAVERQLIIIGEALNRLSRVAPDTAARIDSYRKIIGFRNMAVHGYDIVEDETVWGIVESHWPALNRELDILLKETRK